MRKFSKILENKFDMATLDTYLHGLQDLGFECTIEYVRKRDGFIPIEIIIVETIENDLIEKTIDFYEELSELESRLKEHGVQLCFRNMMARRSSIGFDEDGKGYVNFTICLKTIFQK